MAKWNEDWWKNIKKAAPPKEEVATHAYLKMALDRLCSEWHRLDGTDVGDAEAMRDVAMHAGKAAHCLAYWLGLIACGKQEPGLVIPAWDEASTDDDS